MEAGDMGSSVSQVEDACRIQLTAGCGEKSRGYDFDMLAPMFGIIPAARQFDKGQSS
jgi:hypothetical protein